MKKIFTILALATLFLASCSKDSGSTYYTAIVTVCGDKTEKCTLNLDDNTVLIPDNLSTNPYDKECRALTQYKDNGETEPNADNGKKYRKVTLYSLDKVLTKDLAPNLGKTLNDLTYGTDPIDIYKSWLTVVEDGYVTLHFTGRWGYPGTTHSINLVKDTDSEDACHFELRHNYNGDVFNPYRYRNGIVAFNIKEVLEEEAKSTYDITITYTSHYEGTKNITFHYTPGSKSILGEETVDGVVTSDNDYYL